MTSTKEQIEHEKQALREARHKGKWALGMTYLRFSGPGWLQGAITLGGGSLAGSLYLGVLGGYDLLWLQALAMLAGVVMLTTITYVTLSTGKRPFQAINDHINPVLGWGWAIATLLANVVWCLPQFALGTAAVQQNLLPQLGGDSGKIVICAVLLLLAVAIVISYESGNRGLRIFEWILKGMVGLIVLCFFGVVLKMSFGAGELSWSRVLAGFVPDFGLLFEPVSSFQEPLRATGEFAGFWQQKIVGIQRDVMITATATAVGINMTFLLPYSMLKKGWDKESRGLAMFDLGTGLFIPFVLATSCVVIAAGATFHAQPQPGLVNGQVQDQLQGQYQAILKERLAHQIGADRMRVLSESEPQLKEALAQIPPAEKEMAAMLVRRDAFHLAQSLEPLTGTTFSHRIFGIGVLGMALSTIIILMLISGFTVCEMLGLPQRGMPHLLGCLLPALGVLGPFVWKGETQFWLAVPTSIFGMALLPIAYFTFFLMINNRHLMGSELPRGRKRIAANTVIIIALLLAAIGAGWSIWSRLQWTGVLLVAGFIAVALIVHFVRPPKKPQPAHLPAEDAKIAAK